MVELDEPIEVTCNCPEKPHEKDTVRLYAKLPLRAALAGKEALSPEYADQERTAMVGEAFLLFGVAEWSKVDAKGRPLPVTPMNVLRTLPFDEGGFEVADRATGLYNEAFFAPLLVRMSTSSPNGRTGPSTSPRKKRSSTRRKR